MTFRKAPDNPLPRWVRRISPYGMMLALAWGCFGISLTPHVPLPKSLYVRHRSEVFGETYGGLEAATAYLATMARNPNRMLRKEPIEYAKESLSPAHMVAHNLAAFGSALFLLLAVAMLIGLVGIFFRSWFVRLLLLLNHVTARMQQNVLWLGTSQKVILKAFGLLFGSSFPFRIYVFSDLNERSVALAESVRKGIYGNEALLIFPGIGHTALADDTERMWLNRANALGQTLFERTNLTGFSLGRQDGPVTVFLCKPDAGENFSDAAALLAGESRKCYAGCARVAFHFLAEGSGHVHALETILKRNANGDFLPHKGKRWPRVTVFAHNLLRSAVYRLLDYVPLYLTLQKDDEAPNILIVGSDRVCAEAIRAVSWMGQWKGKRPRLTVVAKDATAFLDGLKATFSELEDNFEGTIDYNDRDPCVAFGHKGEKGLSLAKSPTKDISKSCSTDDEHERWKIADVIPRPFPTLTKKLENNFDIQDFDITKYTYIIVSLADDHATLRVTANIYYKRLGSTQESGPHPVVVAPYVRNPELNKNAFNFMPFWGTKHHVEHMPEVRIEPFGSLLNAYDASNLLPELPPLETEGTDSNKAFCEALWWRVHKDWAAKREREDDKIPDPKPRGLCKKGSKDWEDQCAKAFSVL